MSPVFQEDQGYLRWLTRRPGLGGLRSLHLRPSPSLTFAPTQDLEAGPPKPRPYLRPLHWAVMLLAAASGDVSYHNSLPPLMRRWFSMVAGATPLSRTVRDSMPMGGQHLHDAGGLPVSSWPLVLPPVNSRESADAGPVAGM